MSRRKLIDIQYFSNKDLLLIHEIIDGIRTYTPMFKPTYSFSVLNEEHPIKRDDFFVPVSNVTNYPNIPFSARHMHIAGVLGYDKKEVRSLRGDALKQFKREVMLNPRLFFADNSITFDANMNYQQYFKEEIDPTIQTKILSFDIEVHSDYHFNIYKVLLEILKIDSIESLDNFKKIDFSKSLKISNSSIIKMDIEKNYMLFMNDVYNKVPNISYKDLVLATQSQYTTMEYLVYITDYVNDFMNNFYNNLGFPDQNKAANRIDAISAYDNLEACMYLYLLIIPEDIKRDFNEWLIDSTKVSDELSIILDAYKLKIFLNAHKTFPKENKEFMADFSSTLESYCKTGDEYSASMLHDILIKIKEMLPEVDSLKNISIKFKPFFDELSLIKAFFTDIREVIQPNVMMAHNMFFDVVTLYNRLYRYNENPNYWFNQYGYEDVDDDSEILEVDFRIDFKAKNKKQDKSYVKVAGLVILDSLLLIAKTSQRERDFSLDACATDMLKETKFKYDSDSIINLYSDNIRQFCIYSTLDTFLVDRLNFKMGFVDMFQALLDDCCSVWSEYAMKSIFLTNITKKELLLNNGLATRNNISEVLNAGADDSKFEGAYVTSLEKVLTFGLHDDAFDCDASAFYPSTIIQNNVMTDKLLLKFEDKSLYQAYLTTSKISFSQRYLNGFDLETIYERL